MPALRFCAAVCLTAALVAFAPSARATDAAPTAPAVSKVAPPVSKPASLPMRFEPNLGQTDGRVRFTARTRDGALFLTDRDAVLRERAGGAVRIAPVGVSDDVHVRGLDPLPGVTSYLRGDRSRWRTGVPGFARVRYEGLYPGIDLIYYGNGGHLEYDFVLAAGADASAIRLRVDGATGVEVDAKGDLVLGTRSGGRIRHRAPYCYQQTAGGPRAVAGRYALAGDEVTFALGAHDPRLPLVIDPAVAFATYLGGADLDDGGDVAVDAEGAVYVVGTTTSADFPTVNAFQGALNGEITSDIFVAKLAPDGESLVYSTYLGGSDSDDANAIAVDDAGAAYVAGLTLSDDFPVVGPLQREKEGESDGFLTKLAPDGRSLVFSTYFGGSGDEQFSDVRVRADRSVVAGGRTTSADMPLASAAQGQYGGGFGDGFVMVLAASGSTLLRSTYLGGNGSEEINSVIVGPGDSVYASGTTDSVNFAICPGGSATDGAHGFVAQLTTGPARLMPIGCGSISIPTCVAAGTPTGAGGSFEINALTAGGGDSLDVRVVTLGADLSLVRQREIGGMRQDYPDAITVGADGKIYVVGDTDSPDFPTVNGVQGSLNGDLDMFLAIMAPGTGTVTFATYLGGSDLELPTGVATDAAGNVYVTGVTFSDDFPKSPGGYQQTLGGFSDAFVVKISPDLEPEPDFSVAVDPTELFVTKGQTGSIDVRVGRVGSFDGAVTVTSPDTKAIKIKLAPKSAATTGSLVTVSYKIKKKAVLGTHQLVFTGRDASGRTRSATLELTIQ